MRATALALVTAAGCLSTPAPAARDDGGTPIDARIVDAGPDASPDAAATGCDTCLQLLAIGMRGYDDSAGWRILRHLPSFPIDQWEVVPDSDGPMWNVNDVDWGDCCGAFGGPDGVPDLLAASWYGPWVQQLTVVDHVIVTRPYEELDPNDIADEEAHAEFFDRDGDLDLDVITGQPDLHIYRNESPGWVKEAPLQAQSQRVAVGNWDADAALEVAVTDPRAPADGEGVRVLEGNGGAWDAFTPIHDVTQTNVLWCDLSGGPGLELVAASAATIEIYPNLDADTAGSWLDGNPASLGPTNLADPSMACGDLDHDGDHDLVIATDQGVRVVPHGATAHLPLWDPDDDGILRDVQGIELGDLDADGYPELIAALENDDQLRSVVFVLANEIEAEGGYAFGAPLSILNADTAALGVAWVQVPAEVLR